MMPQNDDIKLKELEQKDVKLKEVSIFFDRQNRLTYRISLYNKKKTLGYQSSTSTLYNLSTKYLCIGIEISPDLSMFTKSESITLQSDKRATIVLPIQIKSLSLDRPHVISNLSDLIFLKKLCLSDFIRSKTKPLYDLSTLISLNEIELSHVQVCLKTSHKLKKITLLNSTVSIANKIFINDIYSVKSKLIETNIKFKNSYLNDTQFGNILIPPDNITMNKSQNHFTCKISNFFKKHVSLLEYYDIIQKPEAAASLIFENYSQLTGDDFAFVNFLKKLVKNKSGSHFFELLMLKQFIHESSQSEFKPHSFT